MGVLPTYTNGLSPLPYHCVTDA